MERSRVLAAIALVVIVCAPVEPASAQDGKALGETLSAGERAEFVKEVVQGCLESQRTAPENRACRKM
jgi:hypothetical protein